VFWACFIFFKTKKKKKKKGNDTIWVINAKLNMGPPFLYNRCAVVLNYSTEVESDFTLLLSFCPSVTRENNTVNQIIYSTYCITKPTMYNTKYSYLSKKTQAEILQKLVNLLLNMHIHNYTIWSYVCTFYSQWKVLSLF